MDSNQNNERSSSMNNPLNPQPVQPVAEPNPLQGAPVVPTTPLVVPTDAQTPVVPPVVSPQNPVSSPGPVSSPIGTIPPEGNKSNTMMIVLAILGVLLAAAIFGGIYWYITNQDQVSVPSETDTANTQNAQEVSNLNQELQSLETINVDTELVDVDRDLQSL